MTTIRRSMLLVTLAALAGVACSDSTGPNEVPPGELNIVRRGADAPPLVDGTVSFWAKQGSTSEGRIFFQNETGGQGDEFLRFTVPSDGLLTRPDGSPILPGDSVLITITVADPELILFEMQPAGLRFNPLDPAELEIEYASADDDLDEDGDVDGADAEIEDDLAIWLQEEQGGVFVRLTSTLSLELDEIEADVLGFSRYAIAY